MSGESWHGTPGGYTGHACRCDDCRAAARERHRQWRRRQYNARSQIGGRFIAPLSPERHGQVESYRKYGCRCAPCTDAARRKGREYVQKNIKLRDGEGGPTS